VCSHCRTTIGVTLERDEETARAIDSILEPPDAEIPDRPVALCSPRFSKIGTWSLLESEIETRSIS
jgi:hypothetical protein